MRIVTFLTDVSHCSVLLTSQHSLVLLTLVHTLSDVLDGFLLRLLGVCQAMSLLCRFSVRFVRSPRSPCSSARPSVLSALCCFLQRHILHNLVCEGPPSFTWFEHPTEGCVLRDRSLWLCAAHVSSTMACLMLSRHRSLCSLISAFICAVLHTSLGSPPAGCTHKYASCALRETTLCASGESSVHHCLSLKAVLFSRLRDSTTPWSAEAFNTTGVVVVRGKTSCVPSLFLSCTAARWPSTHASGFC